MVPAAMLIHLAGRATASQLAAVSAVGRRQSAGHLLRVQDLRVIARAAPLDQPLSVGAGVGAQSRYVERFRHRNGSRAADSKALAFRDRAPWRLLSALVSLRPPMAARLCFGLFHRESCFHLVQAGTFKQKKSLRAP